MYEFSLYFRICNRDLLQILSVRCTEETSTIMDTKLCRIKPRSHALIYTRCVNYTYMYNLHPGVFLGM